MPPEARTALPMSPAGGNAKAAIEPLLSIRDLSALLSCSRRSVEGMRSAGRLPRPDLSIGKMPRWRPETIRRWIERGGRP
jgi:predicted DNA-binding transcriptional regulator AlpA